MQRIAAFLKVAAVAAACWASTGHAQHAYYHYFSDTGDRVGQGQSDFVSMPADQVWVSGPNAGHSVALSFDRDDKRHAIYLSAPFGRRLEVGSYYFAEDAFNPQGRSPGLKAIHHPFSCLENEVWGSFTIQQIEFDATEQLHKLEAYFTQQCGEHAPSLTGYINYQAPPMVLSLRSTAGDPVGQGVQKDYFNDTSRFDLREQGGGQLVYSGSGLRDQWMAYLTPPVGTQFEAGQSYSTALYANDTQAGLDFIFQNRPCHSGSQGSLTVHDLQRDANGKVNAIWADFEQQCEGSTEPLRGTISHGI